MTDPGSDAGVDASFRVVVGGYAGALLSGLATTALAAAGASLPAVAVAGSVAAAVGGLVGAAGAGRARGPAIRLGGTRRRWLFLLAAVPFAATALFAPWVAASGTYLRPVALGSAAGVGLAGTVLEAASRTRHADAAVDGAPVATVGWEPGRSGSRALDVAFLVLSGTLAAGNAVAGDPTSALLWGAVGALWLVGRIAGGRLRPPVGLPLAGDPARPELRVYEAGLVVTYPYARTFVPWTDVSGVRLTPEELVLDRGLFDLHFDRDDLDDPRAACDALERTASPPGPDPGAA